MASEFCFVNDADERDGGLFGGEMHFTALAVWLCKTVLNVCWVDEKEDVAS